MAGKYLKARQLAKEIEKKAKKTAEKKKKAKEGLEKAEELLKISRELGVEVDNVEKTIEDAENYLDKKDFDEASEKINEALDELREANGERIKELVNKTKTLHEYVSLSEEELKSNKLLNEIDSFIDEDKYKKAIEKANEAYKLAKDNVKNELSEDVSSMAAKISTLKSLDGNSEKFENKLGSAKEELEEENFEEVLEILKKSGKKLDNRIKGKIDERLDEIKNIEKLIRKNGIDTGEVEEVVSKIEANIKEGEFSDALSYIGQAERILKDNKDELVESMVNQLRKGIEEARELGAPQNTLEEINHKIDKLQEEEDFTKINSLIEDAFEKLEEAKFHKVLKTIAESRENFIKAKEIGIDIKEPMNLLNKARDSLKEGDHKGALEWAKAGRKKVRDLVKEHEKTEKIIQDVKEFQEGLKEFDIAVPNIDESIEKAEEFLKEKNYTKSKEIVDEIRSELDKKAYEKIMGLIEDFELKILTLERMGIESDTYTDMLEESIANTKTGDYVDAGKIAIEAQSLISDTIEEEVEYKINNVSQIVDKIKNNLDVEETEKDLEQVENLIENAIKAKENKNFRKSFNHIKEAEEEVNEWQIGEADQKFSEAEETVDLLDEIKFEDIDVEEYKNKLNMAEDELKNENYTISLRKTEEILEELNIKLRKRAEEFFTNAKMEVVKAKKSGVDITAMREDLIECKKRIKKENYTSAIRISYEVENKAKKLKEERKDARNSISKLNKKLRKYKQMETIENISPAIKLMRKAKESFQNRNYTEARELANKTDQKIKELESKSQFDKYYRKYEDLIEKAEKLSVDTEDIQDKVNEAIKEADEKNYLSAKEKIQNINEKIIETIKDSVKPRIERTRDIINSAKQIGIDITKQEEVLKEAENDLEDNDFEKAIEKIVECQDQIQEIKDKSKKAARGVKRAKDRMEDAIDLHANVSSAREELDEAMQAIKDDEYDKAIKKAEMAEQSIKIAEINRVDKILSTFKEKINEVRNEGVNTSLADNLMRRAEKAKENEDYKEAINLAMQSEGELERIELQQDIAKRSISTTSSKIQDAEEKGINVEEPKRLLEEAEESFKSGFYVKAFDKAVKSGEILNNISKAFEESKEQIEQIEEVVQKIDEVGFEGFNLKNIYKDARRAFNKDNYEKAFSKANKANDELSEIRKKLPNYISDMNDTIEKLDSEGKNIGKARDFINKAQSNLRMGNISESFNFLIKAKEEYGGEYLDDFNNYIDESVSLIKKAKKFGANVGDVEDYIKEARKLEDEDIKKACEKANEALKELEKILLPYSPKLEMNVDGKIRPDKWNKIKIILINKGGGVAKSPKVKIEGGEIKDFNTPDMIKADDSITIKTKVKPVDEAIKIKGIVTRIFDSKEMVSEIEMKVEEGDFKIVKAEGNEKCGICKGVIKKGLDVIICDCEKTYHKLCGERKGSCPNCGMEFIDEEEKEKEDKKASKRVALRI